MLAWWGRWVFRGARRRSIIERMSDVEADVARGMFGAELPVRPALGARAPGRCLRGHDLAIARARNSYHHRFNLTEITCWVCYATHDPLASWCLVDPTRLHDAGEAPSRGLCLVRIPPGERGGVGQLQLRIDGTVRADLDLAVCGPCRRAVLEKIRADVPRRGYGRVLVAAALTMAPPTEYR